MGCIQVLPDPVINKIAAGEVVERPASVVKELLENALDAGADQIQVTLRNGGKDLIAVLDNGCGMDDADTRLACCRHATSKIRDESELASISTLGFRGEALASIAAVSRFELISCADEAAGATRVVIEGGRERSVGRMGFPRGSKVTVEELFFNTPARRKFLRTTATEYQHAQSAVVNMALGHPQVQFRLIHNRKTAYSLSPCQSLEERVHQLFGRELREGMVRLEGHEGLLGYEALLSLPSSAKASRRWQFLFLNGRLIRHPGLNHAVYQAYRTLLMKDRHPAYILRLVLPPEEVDVNVHPAKTEVRLRNAQLLHTVLADRLHKGLMAASRRAAFGREQPVSQPLGLAAGGQKSASARGGAPPGNQLALGLPPSETGAALHESVAALEPPPALEPSAPAVPAAAPFPAEISGLETNPLASEGFHFQPLTPAVAAAPVPLGDEMGVLAQLAATYLLVQKGGELLIVDQHAAHERILFERYRLQFYKGHMVSERYLLPETLELSPQNAILLEQYLPQWQRMGFEIEPFGKGTYIIREVPAILAGKAVRTLVLEVLDELALFGKSGRLEEVFNEIMEKVACHGAVRAGDRLSHEEMEALVAQLAHVDIDLHCPHGRPVWVKISAHEMEKRFKRIV